MTIKRAAVIASLLAATLATASADTPAVETAADQPIDSIWRIQVLPFRYYSVRTLYACDAFEKKIYGILRAVGAHESTIVDARCYGRDKVSSVSVQVVVATPVLASEENIREMTTFTTEDELVAQLRRISLPTAESIERFQAERKRVPLTRDRRLQLGDGDCDLLRDLSEQVFPALSVELIGTTNCSNNARLTRTTYEAVATVALPRDTDEEPIRKSETALWTN